MYFVQSYMCVCVCGLCVCVLCVCMCVCVQFLGTGSSKPLRKLPGWTQWHHVCRNYVLSVPSARQRPVGEMGCVLCVIGSA